MLTTRARRAARWTAPLLCALGASLSLPAAAQDGAEEAQEEGVSPEEGEDLVDEGDESATPAPDEQNAAGESAAGEGAAGGSLENVGDISGSGPAVLPGKEGKEENCQDGIDDDGDSMIDCADADCFAMPQCEADTGNENTDAACSDWVDNDGDGFVDCDDDDCHGGAVSICQGSWDKATAGSGVGGSADPSDDIPELGEGMSVEDLIGKGGDKDGERNDQVCSDGYDNDGDGKTDCADIGCRFDPQVSVCRGTPGLRFSVVANVSQSLTIDRRNVKQLTEEPGYIVGDPVNDAWNLTELDTRITALQLRAFGPIPGIQDSFFLLSGRAENTPRLVFAMASFPIGWGHFINVNSGGGGLSNNLVLSQHKRALVDPPYYLYNSFEQGNGAAFELNGPIIGGWLDYRAYVAGGAGFFDGNVGGRFFSFDNTSYTFSSGAQLQFTPIGYASRWDSQYLYTAVPAAWMITMGARFDRRAQEMFPAVNVSTLFRWWHFIAMAENYSKYEMNFGSAQTAWNLMVGALLWPKWAMWAFDIGQYYATALANPPDTLETDLRRQQNEFMWRMALHIYFYKSVGVASFVIRDRYVGAGVAEGKSDWLDLSRVTLVTQNERQAKIVLQFRF